MLRAALAAAFGPAPARAAAALAAAVAAVADPRAAPPRPQFPLGAVVPPRRVGGWPVTTHQGAATDLAALLRGRVTALQLMFTGCSATCPIQGALFALTQPLLRAGPMSAQLVSLSIDPLADSPAALDAWLRRLAARPGWLAAAPRIDDVDAIVEQLAGGGEPRPAGARDPHTGQVYLVDRQGDLVARLPSLPPPADIAAALAAVAARG